MRSSRRALLEPSGPLPVPPSARLPIGGPQVPVVYRSRGLPPGVRAGVGGFQLPGAAAGRPCGVGGVPAPRGCLWVSMWRGVQRPPRQAASGRWEGRRPPLGNALDSGPEGPLCFEVTRSRTEWPLLFLRVPLQMPFPSCFAGRLPGGAFPVDAQGRHLPAPSPRLRFCFLKLLCGERSVRS